MSTTPTGARGIERENADRLQRFQTFQLIPMEFISIISALLVTSPPVHFHSETIP